MPPRKRAPPPNERPPTRRWKAPNQRPQGRGGRHRYMGVVVKRVFWRQDGTLELRSDNREDSNDFIIRPGDEPDWRVIGKLVRVEKSL